MDFLLDYIYFCQIEQSNILKKNIFEIDNLSIVMITLTMVGKTPVLKYPQILKNVASSKLATVKFFI